MWRYPKPWVSDTTTCVWLDGKDTRMWLYTLPLFNWRLRRGWGVDNREENKGVSGEGLFELYGVVLGDG